MSDGRAGPGYVQVGELSTWYEAYGFGEPLVLLHGGMGTNASWVNQIGDFADRFRVLAPERCGHGHTPDRPGPMTYEAMAQDTIGFLETVVGGPARLVGWSDGGIVGLLVAMARPDLVSRLVVIGANYDVRGAVPEAIDGLLSLPVEGEDVAALRDPWVAASPDGSEHWPVVFAKFREMVATQPAIPREQLSGITSRTLVLVGDDDMITFEHTVSLFRALPNAELAVVPGTSHLLVFEKPGLVNRLVLDFLEQDPSPTLMPLRRAETQPAPESARAGAMN